MSRPSTNITTSITLQKDQLEWLTEIKNKLLNLQQHALDNGKLAPLSIWKLPPLNVDETAPFDPEPLFFRPYPINDSHDFQSMAVAALAGEVPKWRSMCNLPLCNMPDCGSSRETWATNMLGLFGKGLRKNTEWAVGSSEFCDPEYDDCSLDEAPFYQAFRRYDTIFEFYSPSVCFLKHADKPHTSMSICDSGMCEDSQTLTSEVTAAICVLQYRLRHGQFLDHHTLPAIVYSFHHDKYARITQAHWDGGLVIRQSRLLDLRGDEPTTDAFLLVRWMGNTPVGETRYRDAHDGVPAGRAGQPKTLTQSFSIPA